MAGCGGSREPLAHSCVATDQKFIQTATVDVTAFDELAVGFRSGSIGAEEIAIEAFDAAARVGRTEPKDPPSGRPRSTSTPCSRSTERR